MTDLRGRLAEIETRIEAACAASGRLRNEVNLIAVSKTFPADDISAAHRIGQIAFGESRLQEALPKIESLPKTIDWHFIGHLQSNKVRKVAARFSTIHTLCTESQLTELARCEEKIYGFVEVNLDKEEKKSGLFPETLDEFIGKVLDCPQVHFCGLMFIGKADATESEGREAFARVRELNAKVGGRWLSMGMSQSFDVAIQEGSTHVRVGSALFGARTLT